MTITSEYSVHVNDRRSETKLWPRVRHRTRLAGNMLGVFGKVQPSVRDYDPEDTSGLENTSAVSEEFNGITKWNMLKRMLCEYSGNVAIRERQSSCHIPTRIDTWIPIIVEITEAGVIIPAATNV
ncbi:MAG: hypothetical protein WBX25_20455 [Rhodomicrobium sp.]